MADYMEVQMNLVPVEPEEEEGYEYVSPEGTIPSGGVEPQGAEPESGGGESNDVYENAEEADEIPVHPNPVYGERGNECREMEDIPPSRKYGESDHEDAYENAEEADVIPVNPNPVYGERGNEIEDIPVRPNPLYGEL